MANQTARNAISFSTILSRFVTRIETGLELQTGSVRVCFVPDANVGEYLSENGFVVRVRPPSPMTQSGGNRGSYFVDRAIDVFVLTESLVDVGGRDDRAMTAHILLEEAVVDAVHEEPPVGSLSDSALGAVTCKWSPGGSEIMRNIKTDAGLNTSVVTFVVTYRAPLTLNRD